MLELMADSHFHSGSELANCINISRSGVWKQIQVLQNLGIEISAIPGKGYRLSKPLELLNESTIISQLNPDSLQHLAGIRLHNEIDSTNADLMRSQAQAIPTGTVSLAEFQNAGKGRLGRQWVSPLGRNIYLSLLWRFQGGPGVISGLSLAVGVIIIRTLQQLGISEAGLKWPNDIVCQGRKLAGILLEVSGESFGPCTVVLGMGINLYMPAAQAETINQPWTDIESMLPDHLLSRNQLVAELLNQLLPMLADFEQNGLSPYLAEWRSRDSLAGKKVMLSLGSSKRTGIAAGISNEGRFLMQASDGTMDSFVSGEVSLRLAPEQEIDMQ